jgi:hypothetical protein
MPNSMLARNLLTALVLLVTAAASHALTLYVNCGKTSGLSSVGAALKILQHEESGGPDTINVSGSCVENIVISGFDRLTLKGASGASISDASGGTTDVLQTLDSSTVHVEGFTLNGSVSCLEGSTCTFLGDIFQGSPGDGVTVSRSYADLLPGSAVPANVIQNAAGAGLAVQNGAVVRTINLTVQHNAGGGAYEDSGGNLTLYSSSFVNNEGDGIDVLTHSALRDAFGGNIVQGNAGDGIFVHGGSEAIVGGQSVITANGGAGVSVSDLSFVTFRGPSNITANRGGVDVVCGPQFSATRGATVNLGGGKTNCVEP